MKTIITTADVLARLKPISKALDMTETLVEFQQWSDGDPKVQIYLYSREKQENSHHAKIQISVSMKFDFETVDFELLEMKIRTEYMEKSRELVTR